MPSKRDLAIPLSIHFETKVSPPLIISVILYFFSPIKMSFIPLKIFSLGKL